MVEKPGRNQPCPCGSGKKYKKCHGTPSDASAEGAEDIDRPITAAMPATTDSMSVDLAGFPGQQQHWVLVNKFKPEARKPSSPVGHEGEYRVVYVLSRPGHSPTGERDFSFDLAAKGATGDSHLSMSPPAELIPNERDRIELHIDTNYGGRRLTFECHPNAQGFIGRIETATRAANFADADLLASRALSPFLSIWSVTQNIPVHIHQTEITETLTGVVPVSRARSAKAALPDESRAGEPSAKCEGDVPDGSRACEPSAKREGGLPDGSRAGEPSAKREGDLPDGSRAGEPSAKREGGLPDNRQVQPIDRKSVV